MWAFIVAIPSIIIAMLPLAFPQLILWLIGALAAFWILCVFVWLVLRVVKLQSELATSSMKPKPNEQPGWETLEEVDLYLEGWKSTQLFGLNKDDKIRVTASGPKRFTVHLASDLSTRRYRSLKKTSETKNWSGIWDVSSDGSYAIVAEPVGGSAFWVKIRVDRKQNRFVVHVGKMNY
jgi:hypothetical protein